jgi:hypothetical protein
MQGTGRKPMTKHAAHRSRDTERAADDALNAVTEGFYAQMDPYRRLLAGERNVRIPTDEERAEGVRRFEVKCQAALLAAAEAERSVD